jgi:hypothetical protein
MRFALRAAMCIAVCSWAISAVAAKITLSPPPEVTTALGAAAFAKFAAVREDLLGRMAQTQKAIDHQARDCESVEEGSPRVPECKSRAVEVGGLVRAYRAAVADFKTRMTTAADDERGRLQSEAALSAQSVHRVQPISIEFDGEFRASLPDGRTLTGAETTRLAQAGEVKLVTGAASGARLLLDDGTRITLAASTEVRRLDPGAGTPGSRLVFELMAGTLHWWHDVNHTANKHFGVRVNNANVATRGTEFECTVLPDGSARIKVHSGIVDVTPADGGDVVTLRPGQTATVRAGKISA